MPHALLLSPDDQAVSAITGVLEELSVTCERPLDGLSAAQKLNSQSFDLVLVDCENLPAAKLIFDVCRRGKDGNTPVPIAIVDGRAGLPTAFRLGAELILTKPVAKDQARTTIRTAVGRLRKDNNKDAPGEADFTPVVASKSAGTPLERALAAAAGAASGPETPQLTSYADDAASFVPSVQAIANAGAESKSAVAPGLTPKAQSAVEPMVATPVKAAPLAPTSTASPAVSTLKSSPASAVPSFAESFKERTAASQKAARPHVPSDDPVLREIEQTELGELEPTEPQPEAQSELQSQSKTAKAEKPAKRQSARDEHAPVFSSYQQSTKPRGALVGVLGLTIAAAGFYGVWMYQPGFKEIAGPQINRVLALAGMAPVYQAPPSPAARPTNAAPRPAVTAGATPVAVTPNQTTSASTSASGAADSAATPVAGASAPASAAALSTMAIATPTATPVATTPVSAPATKAVALKNELKNDNSEASKKDAADDAPLPGESTAIILSSKGAEKRLAHSVPAKYPAGAVTGGAQGTLVLKEVVDENGKVAGVKLVEGDPALANAAIKAVKQWRYRPYMRDGRAQPFQTVVIMDFQRP
jgi:TonB family protein